MKPLTSLKRFILAKMDEDNLPEVRAYMEENVVELAEAFDTSLERLTAAVAAVADDRELAKKTIVSIKAHGERLYDSRAAARDGLARASAALVGASARWEDPGVARLDAAAVLASLTRRNDVLELLGEGFELRVPMGPLLDVRALGRKDLRIEATPEALVVRWGTAGRLRLRSHSEAEIRTFASKHNSDAVVVKLAPRAPVEAIAA